MQEPGAEQGGHGGEQRTHQECRMVTARQGAELAVKKADEPK